MTHAMNTTKWLAAICVMVLTGVEARAQALQWEDRGYAAVNFGVQPQARDFTELSTPDVYGENASITVPHEVSAGSLFDLSAGYRVWRNMAVVIGFSRFSDSETPTVAAEIPNPAFSNSPRPVSNSAGELSHSESAVHLHAFWMFPMTENFEWGVFAGPSFYRIEQEFVDVGEDDLTEGPFPFGTVTIDTVNQVRQSDRTTAFTVGVDGTYLITPRYGVGGFFRFSGASVDLPLSGGSTISVDGGGVQFGGGLRVRF
jgi:hypothetical protein